MKNKKLVITLVIIAVLSITSTAVFATGNLTSIEQKWIEFQKAVTEKQVADGILTQEEAEGKLAQLKAKLSETEEDDIYNRYQGKRGGIKRPNLGGKNDKMMKRNPMFKGNTIMDIYAELTNLEVEDIFAQCKQNQTSVWDLAEEAGLTEALTVAVKADLESKLAEAVANERITQEQADEILENCDPATMKDHGRMMPGHGGEDKTRENMPGRGMNFNKHLDTQSGEKTTL